MSREAALLKLQSLPKTLEWKGAAARVLSDCSDKVRDTFADAPNDIAILILDKLVQVQLLQEAAVQVEAEARVAQAEADRRLAEARIAQAEADRRMAEARIAQTGQQATPDKAPGVGGGSALDVDQLTEAMKAMAEMAAKMMAETAMSTKVMAEAATKVSEAEAAMKAMTQAFIQGMDLGPRMAVTVTASNCSSGERKDVEHLVASRFFYHDSCPVPCCLEGPFPNVSVSDHADWEGFGHIEKNATAWGRDWLQKNLAPPGVVVLAVETARWLDCTVRFAQGFVKIESSATDFIFVHKAAWEECWVEHGAELSRAQKLEAAVGSDEGMKCSLTKEAVLSLVGSILALYEAKSDTGLRKLDSVRGQALLQYLAINHMQGWPTHDIIVIYGDYNNNYTIHAGRQDSRGYEPSLHVAVPPRACGAVPEHGPDFGPSSSSTTSSSSRANVTAGFIQALLSTPRTVGVSAHAAGEAPGGRGAGGGVTGPGGDGRRGGGGRADRRGRRGAGGGDSGGGGWAGSTSGGGSTAGGSSKHASSSYDNGGKDRGGSSKSDSSSSSNSRTSTPDSGSSGWESFDGDEGLLEAAREDFFGTSCFSLLCKPEMYQDVLQQDAPPISFQPPTREELMEKFAAVLVKAKLQAEQQQQL